MYVKSNRTGKYGEVNASDDQGYLITMDGLPQRRVTTAHFEKQFTIVPEEEALAVLSTINEEENSMPTRSEAQGTQKTETTAAEATESTKKEKKEKKGTGRPQVAGDHPLWFVAKNFVEEMGADHEVGPEGKVKGFRSFKVNGNMFCNINFNKNGITLWVRQEAVSEVKLPAGVDIKSINHMFNGRVHFADNTPENIKAIQEILVASSKYQVEKKANTKKALAEKKREQKAAEKAEKAEKPAEAGVAPEVAADAAADEAVAQ